MSTVEASPVEPVNESGTREGVGVVVPTLTAQNVRGRFVRPVDVVGFFATVPLTKGALAVIDAEDAPLVASWNWHVRTVGRCDYAARSTEVGGVKRVIYMHRVIAGARDGEDVDHADGDGLNNTRDNLRRCTRKQNLANRRAHTGNRQGLKGVWERNGSYRASIQIDGKTRHLGPFGTADEAATAYREAAQAAHGEYARP